MRSLRMPGPVPIIRAMPENPSHSPRSSGRAVWPRPWIVASRLTRNGSSLLAFEELHLNCDSSLHKVMAPIVLCRQRVLVVIPGPAPAPERPNQTRRAPTRPAAQVRRVPPPGPQEDVGAGTVGSGPGVGRFAQQHLICWGSCTTDPWVVATLSQGYNLQF
ncbi:unnamed protein product [Boreogadus saida]